MIFGYYFRGFLRKNITQLYLKKKKFKQLPQFIILNIIFIITFIEYKI